VGPWLGFEVGGPWGAVAGVDGWVPPGPVAPEPPVGPTPWQNSVIVRPASSAAFWRFENATESARLLFDVAGGADAAAVHNP
jgi:hypothetical protein